MSLKVPSRFGRFEIEALLGRGGAGSVYRARDTLLDQVRALKVLTRAVCADEATTNELKEEARRAATVKSEHVATVHSFEVIENLPVMVSELIEGDGLREVSSRLSFHEKLDLARQLLFGIKAIHDSGMVHCDLKPENIKLTSSGRAKIIDFGLATLTKADGKTVPSRLAGTVPYMSPEQLNGDPLAPSSDIFSLGIILYELFAGRRPFEADLPDGIIYSIIHENPRLPSEFKQDIPARLERLILQTLQKDPQKRFSDAGTVLQLFTEDFVRIPAIEAKAPRPTRRRSVVIEDLKNLSAAPEAEAFCMGFREDLMSEISKRLDVVISAEGKSFDDDDLPGKFHKYRCDYLIRGSMQRFRNEVKLNLSVYGEGGSQVLYAERFVRSSDELLMLLNTAAERCASELGRLGNQRMPVALETYQPVVSAYDFYWSGLGYYRMNKPQDLPLAIEQFKRALQVDPDMALARTGLSDVYAFQFNAFIERRADRLRQAWAEAQEALRLDPDLAEAHRSLGRCHFFSGHFQEARECFQRAIELKPNYAIGYRTAAWLFEHEGNLREAAQLAQRALALNPTDVETHLLLGLICIGEQRYTVALATLQRAVELAPDYGRGHYYIGQVYMKLGALDEALDYYMKSIKYTGDTNSHVDASVVYMMLEDYESARRELRHSIESGYFRFIAYYYLGLIDRIEGNDRDAAAHFTEALRLVNKFSKNEEDMGYVLAYRALIMASLGDVTGTKAVLKQIDPWQSRSGEVVYIVAKTYAALGDKAASRAVLEHAMICPGGPSRKEVQLDPHFRIYGPVGG